MAATSSTMQTWRLDETPRLTSPFSFTSAPPTCLARAASCAANKVSKGGLRAKLIDWSEGRDDVDDRDVVYHDHVSASLPTSFAVTRESLARNAALGLGPGTNLLTSLCFSTFATPIFLDPAVLCAVSKRNKEGMIANIIKLERARPPFSFLAVPHPWTPLCRRSHTVLFPKMFLRSLVLVQLPRFQLMRQCRLLRAVWCNLMLPHNSTSRSSSLAGFSQTILWIVDILFVSLRHQSRIHMSYLSHRLDLNSQSLPLSLLLIRTCSPTLTALPAIPSSRLSVPLMSEHTLYAQPPAPRGVQVPRTREPTTLLAPVFVQMQASSPNQRQ